MRKPKDIEIRFGVSVKYNRSGIFAVPKFVVYKIGEEWTAPDSTINAVYQYRVHLARPNKSANKYLHMDHYFKPKL